VTAQELTDLIREINEDRDFLTWVREPPARKGWYWWWRPGQRRPWPLWVSCPEADGMWRLFGYGTCVEELGGWWCPMTYHSWPLPLPEENRP